MAETVRKTLAVLLLVGLALLLVKLTGVLILIFAAILIAVVLRAASDPFRAFGIPETLSVLLGLIALLAILALLGWLFGAELGAEVENLFQRLPEAFEAARAWVATLPFGDSILSFTPDIERYASQALGVAFGAVGVLTNLVLVFISALYLAISPETYAIGIERLFPKAQSERIGDALRASGVALKKYLLGQLFTMTIVGLMVGIGLSYVGVPSAAALGLIVGLSNFIPLIGPFIGAVPGILLALAQSPELALWAAGVYFVAQQLEGNVLTPIVQRQAVSIPPALLLFALAALGALFGTMGVILAAPLAVVIYTLVTMLWSRDTLGHDVTVPGRKRGE